MSEEVIYEDAETQLNYNKEITFEGIVFNHLNKILKLASVEWKGGYYTQDHRGNTIYNPDTRAMYWNAINALADLCLPHFDGEMEKAENDHVEEEKKLFKIWHKRSEEGLPIPIIEGSEEKFKDERVIIKRKLFRELSKFLKRKNYFKEKPIEDII